MTTNTIDLPTHKRLAQARHILEDAGFTLSLSRDSFSIWKRAIGERNQEATLWDDGQWFFEEVGHCTPVGLDVLRLVIADAASEQRLRERGPVVEDGA